MGVVRLELDRGDRRRLEHSIQRENAEDPAPAIQIQVKSGSWAALAEWTEVDHDDEDANPAIYGLWFWNDDGSDVGAHPLGTVTLTSSAAVFKREATGDARNVEPIAYIVTKG